MCISFSAAARTSQRGWLLHIFGQWSVDSEPDVNCRTGKAAATIHWITPSGPFRVRHCVVCRPQESHRGSVPSSSRSYEEFPRTTLPMKRYSGQRAERAAAATVTLPVPARREACEVDSTIPLKENKEGRGSEDLDDKEQVADDQESWQEPPAH